MCVADWRGGRLPRAAKTLARPLSFGNLAGYGDASRETITGVIGFAPSISEELTKQPVYKPWQTQTQKAIDGSHNWQTATVAFAE